MGQQSKTWQKQILKERKHDDLFWYPEAKLPVAQRSGLFADGYTPVGYPGRWIPLIPVAPNAEGSRKIADMLCSLFRLCVPDMLEVTPVLTDTTSLKKTGALYYDWTEAIELDCVCASCGAIERVPHTVSETTDVWLCVDCADSHLCNEFIQKFGPDGFGSKRG